MRKPSSSSIHVAIDKNYDSEFCGSIPLHLVNLIQPHGLLLVLEKTSFRIVQASQNVAAWFSVPADELLEQPLSAFIPAAEFDDLRVKSGNSQVQDKIPFSLTFTVSGQTRFLSALAHPKEAYILLELEESTAGEQANSFIRLYQQIKYITSLLKQAPTTEVLTDLMARELKSLSGFDRVLVYQFDAHWNGLVLAQAKQADMDDYLHLRFPASDVPRQARELYFRNPYRLIPSRCYEPVGMVPVLNPLSQQFTDLADCSLRGVAKVHLEYMANMGIMASMSLPIIIGDQLWGLISCHHQSPKNPDYALRSALELLAGIFSAQVAAREKEAAMQRRVQLQGIYARLLEHIYQRGTLAEGLQAGEASLLELFGLSGAALLFDGRVWTSGQTPGQQEIRELTYWLRRHQPGKVFATGSLPGKYARSQDYQAIASGLLAVAINPEQEEYLLGFRPEVLQTISWGGNPNQAIQLEADGKNYHPRHSFAIYQETVRHTSLPWLAEELEIADTLRNALLEKIVIDNS